MQGPLYAEAAAELGRDFVDHNIEIWNRMLKVLESGEHARPISAPGGPSDAIIGRRLRPWAQGFEGGAQAAIDRGERSVSSR